MHSEYSPDRDISLMPDAMLPHRCAIASASRMDGPRMSVPPRAYW
jgi:hypothetical protein